MQAKNVLLWCNTRQIRSDINKTFQRTLHVSYPLADRLGLETELQGHTGCVNCLEWNENGEFLVSGSDDFNIIVWDASRYKARCTLSSGHTGNVFSVKFLPQSGNNIIASGAADARVRIHCVATRECTQVFGCHIHRIKRLATAQQMPFMLWSGSEDGTVRQFDLRQPHSCSPNSRCSNILINLNTHVGPSGEAKCIAINPLRPEYMAVGCSDPFVRVYDVRMLTLHSLYDVRGKSNGHKVDEVALPNGCVSYFSPGHLPQRYGREQPRRYRHLVTTYLTFSPDGKEVLANLGGEHVYLFNVNEPKDALKYSTPPLFARHNNTTTNGTTTNGLTTHFVEVESSLAEQALGTTTNGLSTNGYSNGFIHVQNGKTLTNPEENLCKTRCGDGLPAKAKILKQSGNEAFSRQNFYQAIVYYNQALELAAKSAILYANRAAAFLKRQWEGDIYAALRDCHITLGLDPEHSKAHYRQARCLYELRWYQEALVCLNDYKSKFPNEAEGYSTKKLEQDIRASAISETEEMDDEDSNSSESPSPTGVQKRRRRRPNTAPNDLERIRQEGAQDYDLRFVGACNTTTDIKETNFFGSNGQFIVAGSDCGCMFVWDRSTANLVEAWHGDESIVNCLQPHPTICLLATSGIDPVVRLWSPQNRDGLLRDARRERELESLVRANQKRMNADPLELMLMNMGYRARVDSGDGSDDDDSAATTAVQCRTH